MPTWVGLPLFAAAYYGLARLGIAIAYVDPIASAVWPAAGFALGVVLLGGNRFLPGIFIGEFLAIWQVTGATPAGLGPAALSGLGNVAEAFVARWAIRRWLGSDDILRRPVDVYPFAAAVGILAAPISATAGLVSLYWGGADMTNAARIWGTWWIGDCASMMVITPVIMAWARPWTPDDPDLHSAKFWVSAACIVAMFGIVFYTNSQPPQENQVLTTGLGYWTIGAFIWSIALLGRRGTATSYLALATASIIGIYNGRITGDNDAPTALIQSAAGLAVFHLAVLPIGILVDDRRKTRAQLESKVEERTRELKTAMTELRAAKEAAEVAGQAKANFLATMSHEIRTPLNAVIGTAEMLDAGDLSGSQRAAIETIRTSSEHLLSVINDVLDYSKAEAGRLHLDTRPIDLSRIAQEAVQLVHARIENKPVQLRVQVEGQPWIVGDPHRVRQILLNYLSNAVKFTDAGEIVLGVEVTPASEGTVHVHLYVRDTGIGIDPARQGQLFLPFAQIAPATTRATGGTGLGLAIVKRILDAMGGSVSLDSAAGKGSTFHARFVARRADEASVPAATGKPSGAPIRELRILLAEDNAVNRQVALRMLAHLGQKAETTQNGKDAVRRTLDRTYDLVLMDLHMPDMDGLEATQKIRSQEKKRRTRIVAMTADALVEDRDRCIAAGMDDYVSKPVRLADLERVLREASAKPNLA